MVKYAKDTRYSDNCLATHHRDTRLAFSAEKLSDIPEDYIEKCTIIGIDEGQFFEDLAEFSVQMANNGKIIIIAALDGTFQQKPFQNVMNLIPYSESVVKLSSVCMSCFKEASFSRRLTDDTRVKVIGNQDSYAAVCRRCLLLPMKDFLARLDFNRSRTNSGSVIEQVNTSKSKRKSTDQGIEAMVTQKISCLGDVAQPVFPTIS